MTPKKNAKKKKREKRKKRGKSKREILYDKVKKSKIMSPSKIVVEPQGVEKMSEVIIDVAKPLLDVCENVEAEKKAISIAIIVWNICLLPESEQDEAIQKLCDDLAPSRDASDIATFMFYINKIMERKKKHYSHIIRAVVNYHISDTAEGFHLDVASTLSR